MDRSTIPAPAHQPGEALHGFTVQAVTELADIKALAYELTHERTGAQVLHVHCNDPENMFSVGFRTPPPDSTGVAHILEHSVLAGSEKFPVSDAFQELSKRTLNTFLNAMTWPDRTVYPTCSAVRADYFNLANVYCDLVFKPRLLEQTFQQEGHHLDFATPGDTASELTVKGVVYNEMKGAYSSPEQVVYRQLRRKLLPDTPYAMDSGGDPEVMPELTYEQFCRFHQLYYSPSNARFMLYGDVPLADNLAFLEGVLEGHGRLEVDSSMPLQPRWDAPRTDELVYPIGEQDDPAGKSFVCFAWLCNETTDAQQTLALEVAFDALVGSSAAPLRKALVDSGLGSDLFPAHCETEERQVLAAVGLRGTEAERADEIEALITSTLAKVVEEGLSPELIEGSLHQLEFSGKEISPPFPIWLLVRANGPWYADSDPKLGLDFNNLVEQTRAAFAADPRYFEGLIQRWLIDNPHRLRLVAKPSTTLAKEREAAFKQRMAARKAELAAEQLDSIAAQAEALRVAQQTPDSPEQIATLPALAKEDIPAEAQRLDVERREHASTEVSETPVFSNGVGYLSLGFDARDLSDEESLLLPLVGRATTGMGAAGLDYEAMSKRIGLVTGGVSSGLSAGTPLRADAPFARISLDGKVLTRNAAELTGILHDLLTAPDPSDNKRLADLIREKASRMVSRVVPSGHQFAFQRAAASLSQPFWRREQWSGTRQIRFLKELVSGGLGDADVAALGERIAALQQKLFTRARLAVSTGGDPEVIEALTPHLDQLIEALPAGTPAGQATPCPPELAKDAGVVIPAEVCYVARVLPMPKLTDPAAPAISMLSSILASDYLYKKVRVEGGAYGGFALYRPEAGLMAMLSYRDPNLEKTFEVYDGVIDYVDSALDDAAVEASRIGALGKLDRPTSPLGALETARARAALGITHEDRQAFRDGMMSVSAADIKAQALPYLKATLASGPRCVLAARERLEQANETLSEPLEIETYE